MTLRAVLVAAPVVAALGGCILFSDFSGLEGGQRPSDASPGDGTVDPGDAGDAAPFACAPGALLCDTFSTTSITPTWDRSYTVAGSAVGIEADPGAPSSPNVLVTTMLGQPGQLAYLGKDLHALPTAVKGARLRFSIRPERFDKTGRACVAAFVFDDGSPGAEHAIRILVGDGNANIDERFGGESHEIPFTAPPLARWSTISVAVDSNTITASVDGTEVASRASRWPWAPSVDLRLVVGLNFALDSSGEGFAFRFDDVRFDGL
jgi:hypothetical protein